MPFVSRVEPGMRPSAERQNTMGDMLNAQSGADNAIVDDFGVHARPPVASTFRRRRFKLKTALSEDGSATAYIIQAVSGTLTTLATEFTVHDGMGEFSGVAGTLGLAEYWDDMGRWEVYQMACEVSDIGGTGTGLP